MIINKMGGNIPFSKNIKDNSFNFEFKENQFKMPNFKIPDFFNDEKKEIKFNSRNFQNIIEMNILKNATEKQNLKNDYLENNFENLLNNNNLNDIFKKDIFKDGNK